MHCLILFFILKSNVSFYFGITMQKIYALILVTSTSIFAQNQIQHNTVPHHKRNRFGMGAPKYAWADPKIKLSPPPSLMGKQMGAVETVGIPPLGYEMDGDVK